LNVQELLERYKELMNKAAVWMQANQPVPLNLMVEMKLLNSQLKDIRESPYAAYERAMGVVGKR
jgi:hypothetical protein